MNKLISISPQRLHKSTTKGNGKNEMLYIKQLTLTGFILFTYFFTDFEKKKKETKTKTKTKTLFCSLMCSIRCPDTFFMYAN